MQRSLRIWPACLLLSAIHPCAGAANGLEVLPPWQQNPAPRFTVHDGALWADETPMPLLYEFTWSAPRDAALYRYHAQFLGNSHWHPIRFDVLRTPGFAADLIDAHYADAARYHIFMTLSPGVQSLGSYAKNHPEARMLDPTGKPGRTSASFMDPGWRKALAATMTRLARHVAGKPYHLGYYPQDEYAYRMFGGYEPASLEAFRKWTQSRYGPLTALNRRWGTRFPSVSAIEPPRRFEKSVFFADWQTFRQWAQLDYTRLVYQALKRGDPNGMVLWSLPFWGSWRNCASWWAFAPVTDIFMRHGIGYATGIYRLQMLRALQETTGKPANALCMPPNFNPTYVQYGFLLDGPRTGLSHVCVGGSAANGYYMGAADSEHNWKRREPLYTKSRALNDLVRQLGATYLLSKRDQPPVGVFVEDRTVLLNGVNLGALNGILNLLSDLNLEVEIFSEKNLGDLHRFKVVFAGSYARCLTGELAAKFKAFVKGGGALILTTGAFSADWYNRDAGTLGFGWEEVVGLPEPATVHAARTVAGNVPAGVPADLPVAGEPLVFRHTPATPLAVSDGGAPVIVRNGAVFYFGVDPGIVYSAGYTDDFLGVNKTNDKPLLDEFAGFSFDHGITGAELLKLGAHKAYARLLEGLLAEFGVRPQVTVAGVGQAIGALRARLLHHGGNHLVCLANRVVEPGHDPQTTPAEAYYRVHHGLDISVALSGAPKFAVKLPFAEVPKDTASPRSPKTAARRDFASRLTLDSLPSLLSLQTRAGVTRVRLPRLVDVATILLTSDYRPVLGTGLTRRAVTAGETVTVVGRVVNASPRVLSGRVRLDAETPLKPTSPIRLTVAPGTEQNFRGNVLVPAGTKPGYYLVQWVGEFGGKQVVSTSLELEVLEDARFTLVRERLTRFPAEKGGAPVEVHVTSNRPETLRVTMTVEVPAGYRAEPARQQIRCTRPQTPATARALIRAVGGSQAVSFATVRLATTIRGKPVTYERKLRLARGAVTYREPKSVRYGAAEESRHQVRLVVLENPQIKATFIEAIGVLHELILNETGTDHLAEGDYPFGFTWYGGPSGWHLVRLGKPGDRVEAVFAGRAKGGGPVTLTATLGKRDSFVELNYNTDGMTAAYGAFYLMSRLSKTGEQDTMFVPLKSGVRRLPWKRGGQVVVEPGDLAERWLAIHSAQKDETLFTTFTVPALEHVLCRPRSSSWHYWIFALQPEPPGVIRFRLGAVKGGVERARRALGG